LIAIGCVLGIFIKPLVAMIYTIIILALLIIFSICFCKKAKKELYRPENPQLHKQLYIIMNEFDKLCQENAIQYWIIGGTALGAVRNKGVIPHDDDIDVGMFESDFKKLDKLLKNNPKWQHDFTDSWNVIKFKYKTKKTVNLDVFIDIFLFKREKDKIILKEKLHQNKFGDTFYESELFPLKRYHFGTFKVNGPHKIKKYLDRKFNNWRKIRIDWPHHVTLTKSLMCIYNRLHLFP